MQMLVTNDDGIDAEGIHVLARALEQAGYDIVVAAPSTDMSGVGAALGVLHPDAHIEARTVQIDGLDAPAYAVAGPPALCTVAARLGAFGDPPDVIVSGINTGLNTGRAILHSGTVGACLAAQNFGAKGLAISVASGEQWRFDTAAQLAIEVLPTVIEAPPRSVLNLNVPARAYADVRGIRWARLAPFGAVRAAMAHRGDETLQFELRASSDKLPPDCDTQLCDDGYATLTTLVGIAEAWPHPDEPGAVVEVAVPGGPYAPVHTVADFTDHRTLRSRHLSS